MGDFHRGPFVFSLTLDNTRRRLFQKQLGNMLVTSKIVELESYLLSKSARAEKQFGRLDWTRTPKPDLPRGPRDDPCGTIVRDLWRLSCDAVRGDLRHLVAAEVGDRDRLAVRSRDRNDRGL